MTSPQHGRERPEAPIESYEIAHPAVPPALDGLRILHIADLHIRAKHPFTVESQSPRPFERLLRAVAHLAADSPPDLVCLVGDYAHQEEDATAAVDCVRTLIDASRPRYGAFAILGNHDHPAVGAHLVGLSAPTLPLGVAPSRPPPPLAGVNWLNNAWTDLRIGDRATLRLIGSSEPEDLLLASDGVAGAPPADLTIALAHQPTQLFPARHLGIPLVLAGHTHGGQFRLAPGRSFHTSSDLPGRLAAGVLRLGNTLCCISRGLGESAVSLRINCPQQAPLLTLRTGPLPTMPAGADELPVLQMAW